MALIPGLVPNVGAESRLRTGASVSGKTRAEVAIDLETGPFLRALERYVRVAPQNVTVVVKTLAFKLEGKIKKRTPVDTGRARSSWHTVVSGEKDAYTYTAKKKDGTTETFNGALSVNPADPRTGVVEALVGSNVEYMTALENGWSKQRPEGMVRVSIAELRGEVEQAIVKVLADNAKGQPS